MATVPLRADDCDLLATVLRTAAVGNEYFRRVLNDPTSPTDARVAGENVRLKALAEVFERAALMERTPPIPDRFVDRSPDQRGPAPEPVDTFRDGGSA